MLGALLDRLREVKRRRVLSPDLATGRLGEDLAQRYLQKRGYIIVARNYRLASGEAEADLIAWQGGELVIVEVKTRATAEFGPPDKAIGPDKERHLRRVARQYARKSGTSLEQVRIDVIGIVLRPELEITLFPRAVSVP